MNTNVIAFTSVNVRAHLWLRTHPLRQLFERRGLSIYILALIVSAVSGLNAQEENGVQRRQPNIVLVMADDLGINEVGCYGSKVLKTPNIDAISRSGLKFNCAYSGSTVCAPARCILMTGQHAGQCSVRVNTGGVPLPDDDITIAEMLKSVGYATGGFGKWALGVIGSEGDPLKQGFDEFYGYYHQTHAHSHYAEYLIDNGKRVRLEGNIGANLGYEKDGFISEVNPVTGKPLVYAPYLLMERAEEFIRKNAKRPFFCYLPLTVPHGHFHIPETDPATDSLKELDWSDRAKAVGAMTQLLDRQMGDLVALLKKLNIDDNTIIMFCSDHGAALRFDGEVDASGPFRGFKRSMYEGGLRIPMIVCWPERIKPRQSEHVVYLGDIFSTLKDIACETEAQQKSIASMLASQSQSSVSFAPTLFGDLIGQKKHEFLFWEFYKYNPANGYMGKKMQALRAGKWKMLRHTDDRPWELYDLERDPYEAVDLAGQQTERVSRLEKVFHENRVPPMRQQEALVDWMAPFTWATRDRFEKFPEPTIEKLIADSDPDFRSVAFDNDAVMLGLTRQKRTNGMVQINIAWQLKKVRRSIRVIHLCDDQGQLVRQFNANKMLFDEATDIDEKIVDSFVLTPKQLESIDTVAVGFYEKGKGMSMIVDPKTGKMLHRLTVLKVPDSK